MKYHPILFILTILVSFIIPLQTAAAVQTEVLVSVTPSNIQVVPGDTFNISICVQGVTSLCVWQVVLYYNNVTLEAVDTFEGPFLNIAGGTVTPEAVITNDWNDTQGRVAFGSAIVGQGNGASGNGVLGVMKFVCKSSGESSLTICRQPSQGDAFYSYLLDPDLNEMAFQVQDGYVVAGSSPHDVAITSVQPSATSVFPGELVSVKIVGKNVGTMTESFNVSVSYDSKIVGIETLADMAPEEERTLDFVWNTSGLQPGTYVIKGLASVISGEIVVSNNIYVDSSVTIKPPYDLVVSLYTPTHFKVGQPSMLGATISNIGWATSDSVVELRLLIGENVVNSTVLTRLEPGNSWQVTYTWVPALEGRYDLKAYAPPPPDEGITSNNIVTRVATVVPSQLPTVQVELSRTQNARVGELVRAFVKVYDVKDLIAWQLKLSYNPCALQFRSIWLPDDHVFSGMGYTSPHPLVGEGNVTFGAALIGAQPSFQGNGTLVVIDFKAKATDYSPLLLDPEETYLLDSNLTAVSAKFVNSEVWIQGDHIEITGLQTTETQVYSGWLVLVNVTTRNNWYAPHSFRVTVYFADELKVTQEVSLLPPNQETTLTFTMDTSTLTPYIHYAVWAEAGIVVDETYASNNFYCLFFGEAATWSTTVTTVTTRTKPDVNGDTRVDFRDIAIAAIAFGSFPGNSRWNLLADMNQDNRVNLRDVASIAKDFGKRYL